MKNVSRFVVGLTFVGALVAAGARPVLAQDPVKVAPDKCKVLFENDVVRVYEFTLKPGEKMPMHSHPQTSIYSLTDSKLSITVAGGKPAPAEFKAGQANYHGPVTHEGVNTGTTDVHLIITEIKGPPSMTQK